VRAFLAVLLAGGLAGCGRSDGGTPADAAAADTTTDAVGGPTWVAAAPPQVSVTDEVLLEGADLVAGTYWASVASVSGDDAIVFRIGRARFGKACDLWAEQNLLEDGCLNDYAVETYPEAYAALSDRAQVSVADPTGPGRNLAVDATTLHRLVRGEDVRTPEGYAWVPFPFVVVVDGGIVVDARQLWVP